MAKIPMKLDPVSDRPREVTVIVYVDGKEYTQTTQKVEEWAIPYVSHAVLVQVEDPDYDAASDAQAQQANNKIGRGF